MCTRMCVINAENSTHTLVILYYREEFKLFSAPLTGLQFVIILPHHVLCETLPRRYIMPTKSDIAQ